MHEHVGLVLCNVKQQVQEGGSLEGMPFGSQSGLNLNEPLQVGMFMAASVRNKQEIQQLSQTTCSLLTDASINIPT